MPSNLKWAFLYIFFLLYPAIYLLAWESVLLLMLDSDQLNYNQQLFFWRCFSPWQRAKVLRGWFLVYFLVVVFITQFSIIYVWIYLYRSHHAEDDHDQNSIAYARVNNFHCFVLFGLHTHPATYLASSSSSTKHSCQWIIFSTENVSEERKLYIYNVLYTPYYIYDQTDETYVMHSNQK